MFQGHTPGIEDGGSMKVLIVEDEKAAVRRLKILLGEMNETIEVAGICDTVKKSVEWLRENNPDLAFLDIQLADSVSFEIFNQVEVSFPVIFTTAYDQYALRAFEVNSIDYLLKPIRKEQLERALKKYRQLTGHAGKNVVDRQTLTEVREMIRTGGFKERFVVRYGDHLKSIPADTIHYFISESKATFIVTFENKRYLTDHSLEEVERMVDPVCFFRINRKYIIRFEAIRDIIAWSNSRLRLHLTITDDPGMIVAREKVGIFKEWLEK
jgi:two-component system, LytTR family, response regulator